MKKSNHPSLKKFYYLFFAFLLVSTILMIRDGWLLASWNVSCEDFRTAFNQILRALLWIFIGLTLVFNTIIFVKQIQRRKILFSILHGIFFLVALGLLLFYQINQWFKCDQIHFIEIDGPLEIDLFPH